MSFTSWIFAPFVVLVLVAYYLPPLKEFQVAILVAASLIFYSSGQLDLLPLLLATLLGTYVCLRLLLSGRQEFLAIGIIFNLSVLAFFKYKYLFITAGSAPLTGIGLFDFLLRLPLPIGISFFVFHNISLLIDVGKNRALEDRVNVANALLYLAFFPQLVSGPIARASSFLPQITEKRIQDVPAVVAAKWIIAGYFFKLFVANNLNQMTSSMNAPIFEALGGGDRIILLFLYSFQIYADFFGYSAIAVGLALLFGYRLPVNFRYPYIATSFSEFWTRWHISLSTWLRTYLYVPLGGNRLGNPRTYVNLMIVMGLGGLWHGAGLNYVAWGVLHGLFLVAERPFLRLGHGRSIGSGADEATSGYPRPSSRPTLAFVGGMARIMLVFVCISVAWVFFKLPTFSDAAAYMTGIIDQPLALRFPAEHYWLAAIYASPVMVQHGWILLKGENDCALNRHLEPMLYGLLITLAVVEAGPDAAFIYFQF